MPELPDITVYVEALGRRIVGQVLERVRVGSPFLLRTFEPELDVVQGRTVREVRRLGKRIAVGLDDELWLIVHLMIAGRLHWKSPGAGIAGKSQLAAFDFPQGTLLLTEAGTKHRAGLWVVSGSTALAGHHSAGLDVLNTSLESFTGVLRRENHTLKRALTDPRQLDGIGNAYSDEILHRAGLSPLAMTQKLSDDSLSRLHPAAQDVLREWTVWLREQAGDDFPEHVTAFRPEMAVHGRFRRPCPVCGTPVQRIRYAENETNYCPRCQTGGRVLADRSLSRLLKSDWPRTVEELK